MEGVLCDVILSEFDAHSARLKARSRARREAVQMRNIATDTDAREAADEGEIFGKRMPGDEFQGDVNIRTLRALLVKIDEAGFERSAHQMKFHSAFERSVARVLYKADWGVAKPIIMKRHGWKRCSSEVLISTPRRFGKTFSIAIFTACLALTQKCEIVIFSASPMEQKPSSAFVRLLGHEPCEYNQEQARVKSYDGNQALIRSFP